MIPRSIFFADLGGKTKSPTKILRYILDFLSNGHFGKNVIFNAILPPLWQETPSHPVTVGSFIVTSFKKKRSGAFSGFPRLSILHQLSMLMVANDPHFSQRNKRCLRRAHQLRGTAGMDFCCWHRDVKNDWSEECDNIFKQGVLNYGKCDVFRYGSLEKVGTIVFLARNDSV